MGLKFGFGASAGHYLFKSGMKLGSIILTAGFLRAAYVEAMQHQGEMPEDGRGFLLNGLVYSGKNVQWAYDTITDLNDATKVSP